MYTTFRVAVNCAARLFESETLIATIMEPFLRCQFDASYPPFPNNVI